MAAVVFFTCARIFNQLRLSRPFSWHVIVEMMYSATLTNVWLVISMNLRTTGADIRYVIHIVVFMWLQVVLFTMCFTLLVNIINEERISVFSMLYNLLIRHMQVIKHCCYLCL